MASGLYVRPMNGTNAVVRNGIVVHFRCGGPAMVPVDRDPALDLIVQPEERKPCRLGFGDQIFVNSVVANSEKVHVAVRFKDGTSDVCLARTIAACDESSRPTVPFPLFVRLPNWRCAGDEWTRCRMIHEGVFAGCAGDVMFGPGLAPGRAT